MFNRGPAVAMTRGHTCQLSFRQCVAAVVLLESLASCSAARLLQRRVKDDPIVPPVAIGVPTPSPTPKVAEDPFEDCFEVPESVCLHDSHTERNFIVTPLHHPEDMGIWFSFDQALPLDDSGHKNHLTDDDGGIKPVKVGPGLMGKGASAAFDGQTYGVVRSTGSLDSPCFTIAIWIYLLEDSVGKWRTVFNKGGANPEIMGPSLLLWPEERRLQVRSFPRSGTPDESVLNGAGLLPMRRWTHVAMVNTGSVLRLYVNGVKDGEVVLSDNLVGGGGNGIGTKTGSSDLYLGRDPWRAGTKAYIDDFRWYKRGLSVDEIRALIYPSLTGMVGTGTRLGCSSCTFTDAVRHCGTTAHLCSLQELFAGGFHVARAMGWLTATSEVWYHNEEQNGDLFNGVQKLGLCCAN